MPAAATAAAGARCPSRSRIAPAGVGGQQPLEHLAPERGAAAPGAAKAERAFDHHRDRED